MWMSLVLDSVIKSLLLVQILAQLSNTEHNRLEQSLGLWFYKGFGFGTPCNQTTNCALYSTIGPFLYVDIILFPVFYFIFIIFS